MRSMGGVLSICVRRVLDILVAVALLTVAAPIGVVLYMASPPGGSTFVAATLLGANGRPFRAWRFRLGGDRFSQFATQWRFDRLPILWNLLRGQLTLVGPRAVTANELGDGLALSHPRFRVKPGLVCLWSIRQRANIAYGTEWSADAEYVATRSLRGDMGILVRSLVTVCYGKSQSANQPRIQLFDIAIDNLSMTDAVQNLVAGLDGPPRQVCFVNADCVNIAHRDAEYRAALQSADLVLADGIGMKLAGRLFRREIRENLNGTDLCPRLFAALEGTGKSVFLLGGRRGVARRMRNWIAANYPGTIVAGCHHGYFSADEEPAVIEAIAASKADVLLVAFGAPRQDRWIREHLAATGTKAALGVGGLFDYFSGRVVRAPQWIRELGMEWLFRMVQEPGRLWKRYLIGNAVFLYRALRLRFGVGAVESALPGGTP